MSHRRAVYASRFLRPPSWTKRLLLREKPRELTGPYENPVRRWVRLREKARQFSELPPPRKIPFAKPARKKLLQPVDGVPRVSPEALERRIAFLLSPLATEQQLAAPLRPGLSPYYVEFTAWERQLRDLRRCYRAQYLQKLAEVTEIERAQEEEMYRKELEERKQRKKAHLQRVGEEMKRRAILKDRQRIEGKVNEAMEMARRSKLKRQRIYWFRRMENMSKLIASSENWEQAIAEAPPEAFDTDTRGRNWDSVSSGGGSVSSSGVLLSRNVSVPFLLRQLGGAKGYPLQRSRRIPHVFNVQREVLESSYDLLPEDAPRFDPPPPEAVDERRRAAQLYGVFTAEEKRQLLEQKISMLEKKLQIEEESGKVDQITIRLLDELKAARLIRYEEAEVQAAGKQAAEASRGADPKGMARRMALGSSRKSDDIEDIAGDTGRLA